MDKDDSFDLSLQCCNLFFLFNYFTSDFNVGSEVLGLIHISSVH